MRTYLHPLRGVALAVLITVAAPPPPARPAAGTPTVRRVGFGAPAPRSVGAEAVVLWPLAGAPVRPTFRWPLAGVPRVTRRFDPPPLPWQPGHRGVDLAAAPGAVVHTAGAGVVLFAGDVAGTPTVSVSHPVGLRTTYQPVRPTVRVGDRLAAGDPLAVLVPGHPGCPEPACLHWGLRRDERYLDPLALLGLGRVRLLPALTRGLLGSPRRPAGVVRRRAGPGGSRRAGRTPRPGCRPGRSVAANPGRSRG
ncbi:peptidase M23-like protein [Micromonospora pisi]|uniref:Peptidase M23-like protein n=1 Tax=Micromonospora pisi TaxID=589240 RepID=A0A495JP70_9ACTN|nr:M23 family metallopeptidase [Micromonospora pisi]RKR90746.1 peptidase M23-like protein [Micromonospora pisi]